MPVPSLKPISVTSASVDVVPHESCLVVIAAAAGSAG